MKPSMLSFLVVILAAVTVTGMFLAVPGRAQVPVPMKRVVKPDTPPNRRLVKAAERGDLTAVQAAFGEGASADTLTGWEGQTQFVPAALLASQAQMMAQIPGLPTKPGQFLPVFRLLIQKISTRNAADADFGGMLLIAAVCIDDLASVKTLVEKRADVNTRQPHGGGSALACAVMEGDARTHDLSPVTAYLLDHGAAVNAADERGTTPLMQAAQMGKINAARALLAHGADPALRDKSGRTALRWAAFTPVKTGDEVVALLQPLSPMTLPEAAQFGDVARVRAHLDAGEDPNAPGERGMTPLMEAAKSGSVETARLLLDRGADVNHTLKGGSTALHLAALYGNTAMASLLLDRGADINAARQSDSATPLLNAVQLAQADVVALLLRRGASLKHDQGKKALELAVREAGNGFIRRPQEMPKSRMTRGDAVLDARERVIDLLLGAGVDVHASHALYLAAKDGQIGLIDLLLSKGADVNGRETLGSGSLDDGETALMGAIDAWTGAREDERMIKDGTMMGPDPKDMRASETLGQQCVQRLLAHGANASLSDAQGKTPLMQCVSSRLPVLAEMLLAHGAQVDAANPAGITALMWAVAENDRPLVSLLLTHQAGVDRRDKLGRTALMLAIDDGCIDDGSRSHAESGDEPFAIPLTGTDPPPMPWDFLPNPDGHPAMVRLLLGYRASVSVRANDGTTALSLARKHNFTGVATLLRHAGAGK